MGTRIEAVAVAHGRRGPFCKGALKLADAAARKCLSRAHRDAGEIDLLVNAGIYREDNLAEPALAAMIQEDIGANPGHPQRAGAHGTFSFDVANGGCGVLTALQLLDGFMRSGTIRTGLVVASDSDPGGCESFPFPALGGAMLVRPANGTEGFVDFAFETFAEGDGAFESAISWHERKRHLPLSRPGKNVLTVVHGDGYGHRALECGEEATRRFLARHELGARFLDLVIFSQSPAGWADGLATRLNLAPECVGGVAGELRGRACGEPHRRARRGDRVGAIRSGEDHPLRDRGRRHRGGARALSAVRPARRGTLAVRRPRRQCVWPRRA
jgi:3-oxoacyl-[acyl-carrier-protein] synthase-3